jgi:hypothetical protein
MLFLLVVFMAQYSLSMNEEGSQLDFLNTDLRLELVSDTVVLLYRYQSESPLEVQNTQISGRFQSQAV